MQHITYRPVDRQFGCLERDLPPGAPFNRADPIRGITFGFALETRFPEEVYFGTVEGEVTDNLAIELRTITEAEYDAAYEAEIAAQQPAPPPPVTLTVGVFVSRFLVPDEDDQFVALDDAMMLESRLVKRNWLNDRYSFTEGDGFWTIVSGHLDDIVTAERKAELLAASTTFSQSIAEPLAA